MNWTEKNSCLKGISNHLDELHDPVRVASFDLDDTIIFCSTRKRKESTGKWKLIDSKITNKIADLVNDGYIIIIFTNQSGMSKQTFDKRQWRKAMEDLEKILFKKAGKQYYFAVYVAKQHDLYRKPNIGMWTTMKSDLRDEFKLDNIRVSKKSFYCGDAAGRISPSPLRKLMYPTTKVGDHSDTDWKFALNIGIKFLTPDDFFFDKKDKSKRALLGVNPQGIIEEAIKSKYKFVPRKKELIIMVGPQGSGKSEFVKKYILPHDYVHINQDTCKTKVKCLSMAKEAMSEGKSLVIDNTNPDTLSRMEYTIMAKKDYKYKHIRAIVMGTDINIAKHMNNVRHVYSGGEIPKVNQIGYHIFNKKYVRPQESEHFDEIETVNFAFDKTRLNDPKWKRVFMLYSEA